MTPPPGVVVALSPLIQDQLQSCASRIAIDSSVDGRFLNNNECDECDECDEYNLNISQLRCCKT
jgi:hypothetical protein